MCIVTKNSNFWFLYNFVVLRYCLSIRLYNLHKLSLYKRKLANGRLLNENYEVLLRQIRCVIGGDSRTTMVLSSDLTPEEQRLCHRALSVTC